MQEFGYITALDDAVAARVHALTVGKFAHPVYGTIDITPERIARFAASVNDKVRGIDPDIDYEHKAHGGKAAGWVRDATVENDGKDLFLNVDWTEPAEQEIAAKQWRYFSPEFADEWEDNEGVKHTDVIMGGGITNRPFLKNLAPLNFSEFYVDSTANTPMTTTVTTTVGTIPTDTTKGGNELDPKKLAEVLGTEETDEEKLLSEVKSLHEFKATKMTEDEKTKAFAERYPDEAKQLAELRNTNKLMEADTRIKEWSEKGLPPVIDEEMGLRDFRAGLATDDAAKFDEIIAKVLEVGVAKVSLDEQGGNSDPTDADAVGKFEGAIKKFMEDDKLSYADAARRVAAANPELERAYQAASRGVK